MYTKRPLPICVFCFWLIFGSLQMQLPAFAVAQTGQSADSKPLQSAEEATASAKDSPSDNTTEKLGDKNSVRPLERAHAHNDYLHDRPLLDALDHGFRSVEADVFWVNGKLLVAHTQFELSPKATLESLYLKPLHDRLAENNGSVYGDGKVFTLLIDFKANGSETYVALKKLLQRYPTVALPITQQRQTLGPVQIIISGDRPIQQITEDKDRRVGIDGRLSDLDSEAPVHLMPLISDRWGSHFKWPGRGEFSQDDSKKLDSVVNKVHQKGRRVRFWGIPDKEDAWQIMHQANVDLINTDRLTALRDFLLEQDGK